MKVKEIQAEVMTDNKFTFRIKAINDNGQQIIGITAPCTLAESKEAIAAVVKALETTQFHVPHITPLGRP